MYGITILQAYIYFQNSGKDSVSMRSFVSTSSLGVWRDTNNIIPGTGCAVVVRIWSNTITTLFTTSRSVLDTVSLVLAVVAIFEYVVSDFGEVWLLLTMPM